MINKAFIFTSSNNKDMKTTTLIRVRIYPLDYNGSKSNMTYVTYVEKLEDAKTLGWKYELA